MVKTRSIYRENLIIKLYEQGKSPYEIAEEIGTNHMSVRRTLKKIGVIIRDKSEAQIAALKSGRASHPKKQSDADDTYNIAESEDEYENNDSGS